MSYDAFEDSNGTIVIVPLSGTPKHKGVMFQTSKSEKYYETMPYRGLCQLNYPSKHGMI